MIKKSKNLEYDIPEDTAETGWMAIVCYRDPKDNHRHISIPWEVNCYIDRKDRLVLRRLGKAINSAVKKFILEERARTKKRRSK